MARFASSHDSRAADLLPVECQVWTRLPVQPPVPSDQQTSLPGRERTVLCGVGGKLMEHHGDRLTRFRAQEGCGAFDVGIAVCGIRRKLAPDEIRQRYPCH